MGKFVFCATFILFSYGAFGQDISDGAVFDEKVVYESAPDITTDESQFLLPIEGGGDMFLRKSQYSFSAVRYLRRGYDRWYERTYINNIAIGDELRCSPNYQLMISLNSINRLTVRYAPLQQESSLGVDSRVNTRPSALAHGNSVTLSTTDRAYRFGVKAHTTALTADQKWGYSISVAARSGRDPHIDGLFTQAQVVSLGLERKLHKNHTLSLFAIASPTVQGLRSPTTSEAFELTGNNLYNPSWGYYNGKVRNSKVRKTLEPFAMVTYDGTVDTHTKLVASLSYHTGTSRQSGLAWYDASNPYPDYYRYMPSFAAPQDQQRLVEQDWRNRVSNVVQIDWDALCRSNIEQGETAKYIVENRVAQISSLQANASFQTVVNSRLTVEYGGSLRADENEYFNELEDMLGARVVADVDQFLVDDQYFGDKLLNNVDSPLRKVGQGERFRYNYAMHYRRATVGGGVRYRGKRVILSGDASFSSIALQREGYYEKELYLGSASKGYSPQVKLSTYSLGGSALYPFSPKQHSHLTIRLAQEAPAYTDIFISPRYRNDIVVNPKPIETLSVEVGHNMTLKNIKLTLTGYYTTIRGGDNIRSYYDDISSTYCNMIMRGVDKKFYGGELGVEIKLSPRLSIEIISAIGSATYDSEPEVGIFADSDSKPISQGERARIKGLKLGSTPQTVACGEIAYSGVNGWRATLGVNYMQDSYVSINPLRRTPRFYSVAESPEKFEEITTQQKLPSVATVNMAVMKSMFFGGGRIFVILSINNLLDNKDIVYDGYEQMRLPKSGSGVLTTFNTFPSKFRYAYGRTYFCSANYKF